MDIAIIGTGNTATILSKKLKDAGHNILMVYGRNLLHALELSGALGTKATDQLNEIPKDADIYIIAVSDTAIKEIADKLILPGKILVHTAASVSKDVLKTSSANHGVFYPLQSLKKETGYIPVMPVMVDASDEDTLTVLKDLAYSISDLVVVADDKERLKLHMAAVFCNNFTNHLYALIEDYCNLEKLDFNLLKPLISETSNRLNYLSASSAQTGPALRHDAETLDKHVSLLDAHPHLKDLYLLLTKSIQNFNS